MAGVCLLPKISTAIYSPTQYASGLHSAEKCAGFAKVRRSWNAASLVQCQGCRNVSLRGLNPGIKCSASLATEQAQSHPESTESRLDAFWAWFLEKGKQNSSKIPVRPGKVPEGLGLIAEKYIGSGDEIFAVPESLCVSKETVQSSEVGKYTAELKPWIAVALFLIYERSNPRSDWKPYLNILPTNLDLPLFWTETELTEIQGTQLLASVESYKEYLDTEFAQLQENVLGPNAAVFSPEFFTREAFFWAFGILRSRTFPPVTGEDIALVPLADLLNHGVGGSAPAKICWEKREASLFDRQRVVAMKSGRTYSAGEQVIFEYGRDKSNAQLALDFGFAEREMVAGTAIGLGSRSRDTFSLTLEISENDRFFDDKADVAELNGMATTTYIDLCRGEGPPENMLTFLRLIALGGSDSFLLEALFRNAVWGHLGLPVSKENEEAVCQAMIDGCRSTLAGYNTSIDQDLRLLKDGGLSRRQETAVVVRVGEKRILVELLDWFEARLGGLDNLEYYAERRLRDLGLLDDKGDMTPWVFNE